MRDDLEKAIMEIGEPFTKEEVADMMAVACDTETGKINYEHYINLLIVRNDIYLFLRFFYQEYILSKKKRFTKLIRFIIRNLLFLKKKIYIYM